MTLASVPREFVARLADAFVRSVKVATSSAKTEARIGATLVNIYKRLHLIGDISIKTIVSDVTSVLPSQWLLTDKRKPSKQVPT